MADQFTWWRAALKGDRLDWDLLAPPSGYFRNDYNFTPKGEPGKRKAERRTEAVAIWRAGPDGQFAEDGEYHVFRTGDFQTRQDVDFISELFASISGKPVSFEDYTAFRNTGEWPADKARKVEDPEAAENERAVIGSNSGDDGSDLKKATRALADLKQQYEDWLKSIGGKISSDEEADKAANFSAQFAKYEKRCTALHKEAKQPFLDGGREVDNAWKPVISDAATAKKAAKDVTTPYLVAKQQEADRKAREEAERLRKEAEAQAEREADTGFLPPEPVAIKEPEPVKVKAGTTGRVILKEYKFAVITDPKACAGYFASFTNPPAELIEVLTKLSKKALDAGIDVPGAEIKSEKRAA